MKDMKGVILQRILPRSQANADALLRLIDENARKGNDDVLLTLIERYIGKNN